MYTNQIIKTIRENDFSPFEALLFTHKFLTNKYRIDFDDYAHQSRVVSEQIEKVITLLCMDGLKCKTMPLQTKTTITPQPYFVNIIFVQDPNYAICGDFANDTISDATSNEFENGKGFAHCLFPLSDLLKSKHIDASQLPDKYAHSDSAILPPTYIGALRKVFEATELHHNDQSFNDYIYDEIKNSIDVAIASFCQDSASAFAKCAKSLSYDQTNSKESNF